MLRFDEVSKRFAGVTAVGPLSLELAAHRTTVLIGPSGCGKSTLLRIATGLENPDAGRVSIGGEVLAADKLLHLRRGLGYVIQEGGLLPHLPARDNIALMARWLGWDDGRIRGRLEELSALVQLPAELLDRYPAQLSGGQRQRVSLMRALMLDPPLLLLDEPLGALDPMIRYDLQQELKSLFATLRKTVLLVTHDLAEAAFLGDHLVLLCEGRIVQQGLLEDFGARPAEPFVARFLRAQRALPPSPEHRPQ
jgi:osmoprotectant transport system ATP-binding protein